MVVQTVEDLLTELHGLGVKLWLQDGCLRSRAPEGALTPELRGRIRQEKFHIIEYLEAVQNTEFSPLRLASREGPNPLSFAQQRLWFLDQLEEGSNASYNIPLAFHLQGELDLDALERSFGTIVERHEILRTIYAMDEGIGGASGIRGVNGISGHGIGPTLMPYQEVQALSSFEISSGKIAAILEDGTLTAAARQAIADEAKRPFDLSRDVLLRVTALTATGKDSGEVLLLITLHHIAADMWSVGVLMRELAELYREFRRGTTPSLPELPVQYADFARWQRESFQGQIYEQQLRSWRRRLEGAPPLLELPTDRPRPPVQTFDGGVFIQHLSPDLLDDLTRLSQRADCTLFMSLFSVFALLLARYSQQEDLVIGTPVANRTQADLEPLIGSFVNALVLRTDGSGQPSFFELAQRTKEVALEAYFHQDLPFEALVEILQPERNVSYPPIFQVMFALQNVPLAPVELPDLKLTLLESSEIAAKFDLQVSMIEWAQGLRGDWVFNRALFDRATIQRMARHFENLLVNACAEPRRPMHELPILDAVEQHQLITEWNATEQAPSLLQSLQQIFELQTETCPDAIAVSSFGCLRLERESGQPSHSPVTQPPAYQFSYRTIFNEVLPLADRLRSQEIEKRGSLRIGLHVERSVEMVIGLLSILQAGGSLVSLDPSYPEARLKFVLTDADIGCVLTQESLSEDLPASLRRYALDEDRFDPDRSTRIPGLTVNSDLTTPLAQQDPNEEAYLIYTSGSSGRPKGVSVGHRSVINFLQSMRQRPGLSSEDTLLAVTTLSFDIAVLELFLPWMVGAQVVLASREIAADGPRLATSIDTCRITTLQATPATWRLLLASGWEGRRALRTFSGGEALSPDLAQSLLDRSREVWNLYGPTETTVWSSCHRVEWPNSKASDDALGNGAVESVSIGRPIANTRMYVLDDHSAPVPVGVAGELYIGGAGVALGYWERPERNHERFIPNLFDEGRLYRTGDRCRYLADGTLEFLGRLDAQVKLHGFRIEPGEIEAVLGQHPFLDQAVVSVRDAGLIAYVVLAKGSKAEDLDREELREFLQLQLPIHMIPSAFLVLEVLPLTPNGKVDRAALPDPETVETLAPKAPTLPRTSTEEALSEIWSDVLRIQSFGIHEPFFALGGHSLLATQVVSRIRHRFHIEIPLRQLFTQTTVATLAKVIDVQLAEIDRGSGDAKMPERQDSIRVVKRRAWHPLSFAQQRLWFLDQLDGIEATYNMPAAVRFRGHLDLEALRWSLSVVVGRHESLRTCFSVRDGEARQSVRREVGMSIQMVDLGLLVAVDREREAKRWASAEVRLPFDLENDLMLRARLLRLEERESVLILTTHHIASDGWSVGVLLRELTVLYSGRVQGDPSTVSDLPDLPIQYIDFAHWQRRWLSGAVFNEQVNYWRKQLRDAPPILELPTDRPRPKIWTYRGRRYVRQLSPRVLEALTAWSQERGTPFMTLMAAFQALLMRYSGQEDIVIGTTIANRTRIEIEPLIGFFVNTLAIRPGSSGRLSFESLLDRVRVAALEAYQYQDLPFEMLVEQLQPERDLGHSPLFQTMFTLQNAPSESQRLPELTLTPFPVETRTAKFDLLLSVSESDEGWIGQWEYASDLFEHTTILRLATLFDTLLVAIADQPTTPIRSLPLLNEPERHRLLVDWNDTRVTDSRATDLGALSFHESFERQVEQRPDALAVIAPEGQATYRCLDSQANALAHHLCGLGVGPEVLVGIHVERSVALLVAMLGTLKAGGAYLPLDPTLPRQRLAFMVEDARAEVLLTRRGSELEMHSGEIRVVFLDETPHLSKQRLQRRLLRRVEAEHLAYVLYTSGSTGRPKGVMISQRGLANYLHWCTSAYKVAKGSGAPVHSSIGFDATITALFAPLMAGQKVQLISEDQELDGWTEVLASGEPFSLTKITPAHLEILAHQISESDRIQTQSFVIGGEALFAHQLKPLAKLVAPHTIIVNEYGPTECVVGCCVHQAPLSELLRTNETDPTIPVGRPIANTRLYVLDPLLQPVPSGVVGEFAIAGSGLARGYRGHPALTAARFVPDPFGEGRLYRTGDLVRYASSGRLSFVGRVDQQVKIRGYRIEPGEIEASLTSHPTIREAVVLAREGRQEAKRLIAYVTLAEPDAREQSKRVSDWQQLYAQTYGRSEEAKDPTLDLAGWNSSFTGQAMDEDEMREWVDHTVESIRRLEPKSVVEIGCGTGLLLARLAPQCEHYLGIDFSQEALDKVDRLKRERPELARVSLLRRKAHELDDLEPGSCDLVILNSVLQYFPSVGYLLEVLEGACRLLRPGGRIFLGDIRNFALHELFHIAVQRRRASQDGTREQFRRQVQSQKRNEEELLIDPAFFAQLPHHLEPVIGTRVELQRGRHHNELSCFRYQVVLHLAGEDADPQPRHIDPDAEMDWREQDLSLVSLRSFLAEEGPAHLVVTGIPNARLAPEFAAQSWMEGLLPSRNHPEPLEAKAVDPEDLWSLEKELPYAVHVTWSEQDPTQGAMDAVFYRLPDRLRLPDQNISWRWTHHAAKPLDLSRYGNPPVLGMLARSLVPDWKRFLQERLPAYMVPSAFFPLDAFPLTPHGKIDRKALPSLDEEAGDATQTLPRSDRERQLISIWEEVLGVDSVGIHDDFFALGGHSLLAVRLMSRVQQRFDRHLPLSVLFQHPTIVSLAEHLKESMQEDIWNPLVLIQPAGDQPPFFCVPGAGGNVTYLYWLARHLGRTRPFYGLQAVGLDGTTPPHVTVEEAAVAYLAEIRRVQPHGPYFLGAHSYGGKIAFEMAQQLLRAGESIALLALFDAGPPGEDRQQYQKLDDVEFMGSLVEAVGEVVRREPTLTREMLKPLDHEGRLRAVKKALEEMGMLPPETSLQQARGLLDVFRIHEQTEYFPTETLPLPITFFMAREQEESKRRWFVEGWSEFGSVEVHEVPGTHVAILSEPNVRELATKLSPYLEQTVHSTPVSKHENGSKPAQSPKSRRMIVS